MQLVGDLQVILLKPKLGRVHFVNGLSISPFFQRKKIPVMDSKYLFYIVRMLVQGTGNQRHQHALKSLEAPAETHQKKIG